MEQQQNVPLLLQRLAGPDQALAVSHAAVERSRDHCATTGQVLALYDQLALPRPANLSATLARLAKQQLLVRNPRGSAWRLTPEGQRRVNQLVEQDALVRLGVSEAIGGAAFAGAHHYVVPHTLAPPEVQAGVARLVERFPFDRNVFLMTRFARDLDRDPIRPAVQALRETADEHSLVLHLASDRKADGMLWGNVAAYMWSSKYGIAVIEDRVSEGLNANVLMELGGMLTLGRNTALFKDRTAPSALIPTDLLGRIYDEVDLDSVATVAAGAHRWFAEDLGLGRCTSCPRSGVAA